MLVQLCRSLFWLLVIQKSLGSDEVSLPQPNPNDNLSDFSDDPAYDDIIHFGNGDGDLDTQDTDHSSVHECYWQCGSGERNDGVKGDRGEIGPTGPPGERGVPGLPGDKGEPGPPGPAIQIAEGGTAKGDKGSTGRRGKRGMPGPPGEIGIPGWPGRAGLPGLAFQGAKGDKGEPALLPEEFFNYRVFGPDAIDSSGPSGSPGHPGPGRGDGASTKEATCPVVVQSREGLLKMSEHSSLGTITFVKDEERPYVRVSEGWMAVLMGDLVQALPPISPAELTPEHPGIPTQTQSSSPAEGRSIILAALNDPSNGNTRGVRGADYSCYRQAQNSNLQGTFRAFLSSWVQNLDSIVKFSDRNLPVVNTQGDVLFSSWTDVFQHGRKTVSKPPQIYAFNGRNVLQDSHWPHKLVWHGANVSKANVSGARVSLSNCDAWHIDSDSNVGLASDLSKGELMDQTKISCNHELIILCIEIAPPQNSRRRRDLSNPLGEEGASSASYSPNRLKYSGKLDNLSFQQYTQFMEYYDRIMENNQNDDADAGM